MILSEKYYLESISGLIYPIVYREKGKSKINSCPYCKQSHEHDSTTSGHRIPPCSKYLSGLSIIIDEKIIPIDRGYIIKEYGEEDKRNHNFHDVFHI
jgi:hypothetical protein